MNKHFIFTSNQDVNFIFASLANNDFQYLKDAVEYVYKNMEFHLSETEFKEYVISYMIWYNSIRRINPLFKKTIEDAVRLEKYLEKSLSISFVKTVPNVDHDCGSAVLDTNTGNSWRI